MNMIKQKLRLLNMSRIFGVIVGGTFGAITGFMIWSSPGTGSSLAGSPADVIIAGTILGILFGMFFSRFIGIYISRVKALENASFLDSKKLQLREEQLDITKTWIKKAEVSVHKEIIREIKHLEVPVTREEIVIEKTVQDKEAPNENIETIRIPIAEERIEVTRHPEIKEKVSVYNHEIKETEHVEEILKKEKLHVKTNERPEV